MMEIGTMTSAMARVCVYGLMEINMTESGRMITCTGRAHFSGKMAADMKEAGKEADAPGREFLSTGTEENTRGHGRMIVGTVTG